jgi:LmbE family N-acetylglucosaminyl deacetylase
MAENQDLTPSHALVIMAHPDDPEFSAGGTIARWTRAGARVTYAIVTDGSKGSDDRQITTADLVARRAAEQRAAAAHLGVQTVEFLGFPDCEVYNTSDLRRGLVRQIRRHKPDLVITHDPTARLIGSTRINHPDHIAVGDTALNAVFPLARDRLSFPELETEGLTPHRVMTVLLVMGDITNYTVDITETLPDKLAALKEHRSQIGDPDDMAARIAERAQQAAADTPFAYAERFRRITLHR